MEYQDVKDFVKSHINVNADMCNPLELIIHIECIRVLNEKGIRPDPVFYMVPTEVAIDPRSQTKEQIEEQALCCLDYLYSQYQFSATKRDT